MKRWLVAGLALFVATDAFALDPYMWGVGPRIGTMAIPGSYPIRFPGTVKDDTTSAVSKVKNDLSIGADGVYYINSRGRAKTMINLGFGLGSRFLDAQWQVGYQHVLVPGALDVLWGVSAGVGTQTFGGEGDAKLVVPYYPLRTDINAQIKDTTRAYQLTPFYQLNVPGRQKFTDFDGAETAGGLGFGLYTTVGIEFTLFFGDMEPPRPRKPSGG